MIDEKIEAMVHEAIDGEASSEDRARLQEILEKDPEIRAYFEDMKILTGTLSRIRLEEPPPSVKAGVLRFVEAQKTNRAGTEPHPRPAAARMPWYREMGAAFGRRPAWAGGILFASGLAIGAAVFSLQSRSPVLDTGTLTGSMTPAGGGFQRVTERSIDFEGVKGSVLTGISPEGHAIQFELRSDRETEVSVGFAGRPQAFRGFFQEKPAAGLVTFDPGRLLIHHRGENRYLLMLSGEETFPKEVIVRIRVGERVLEEHLPTTRG
jgi:hypothetical protein